MKNLYNRFNRLEYVSLSPPSSSSSYKKRGNIFPREVFILTGKEFKSVFFLEKEEVRTKKEGRKEGRKKKDVCVPRRDDFLEFRFFLSLSLDPSFLAVTRRNEARGGHTRRAKKVVEERWKEGGDRETRVP